MTDSPHRDSAASRRLRVAPAGPLVALALSIGCSWVELDTAARGVRVAQPDEVTECRKVGRTNVKVIDRIVWIDRPATRVAQELATMARNEAAGLGADSIVPATPIEAGAQSYDLYRCAP